MVAVAAATLVLQVLPVYVPALARFFGLTPLSGPQLGLALSLGFLTFLVVRGEKALRHRNAG
jgi:hypothetical protein